MLELAESYQDTQVRVAFKTDVLRPHNNNIDHL